MARSFKEECSYLEKMSDYCYKINKGFVPNMKVSSFQRILLSYPPFIVHLV